MKKLLWYTLFLLMISLGTIRAQPGNPQAPTPFGFVELLIGAGAVLGGKKILNAKRR